MKVVVISGGSDGLGKALAKQLSKNNKVIILAPNEVKLRQVVEELECDYLVCDVSIWEQVEKAVESIIEKYTKIDVLINNAGVWIEGPIENNSPADIKRAIETNTLGTMLLTRAVVPNMKKNKSGWIINVISQAGIYVKAERTVYNGSKWAITGFTKSLQPELAMHGIKVIGLYPGQIRTDLFKKAGIEKNIERALDPEDIVKTVEFMLGFENTVTFPEIGIKHLEN